ncbi:hypothetical protein M422DRAFT_776510 [Sphaerobolus stellatus SS14]|nr:hypothetical protein M422DRAFT_776510 [Sphaerobolus stellatus SS14]
MGLAGRKVKQRIGADPRNLTWSDDSSKFGMKYLQSLGWSTGSGLGTTGEGRTTHLTVHQKLDLMGIGANRRPADEAGWRGGHEFDGLLARLNQINAVGSQPASDDESDQQEQPMEVNAQAQENETVEESKKESKKKRKLSEVEDVEDMDPKEAKRRRKEDKKARKEKQKAEKKAAKKLKKALKESKGSKSSSESVIVVDSTTTVDEVTDVKVKTSGGPVYRAHRARHLASKRLAAISTKGMSEILGVSASASASATESASFTPVFDTPSGSQTPAVDLGKDGAAPADDSLRPSMMGIGAMGFSFGSGLGFRKAAQESEEQKKYADDNLFLKSTMSMADYFAERMKRKQAAVKVESAPLPEVVSPVIEGTVTMEPEVVVVVEGHEEKKEKKEKSKSK